MASSVRQCQGSCKCLQVQRASRWVCWIWRSERSASWASCLTFCCLWFSFFWNGDSGVLLQACWEDYGVHVWWRALRVSDERCSTKKSHSHIVSSLVPFFQGAQTAWKKKKNYFINPHSLPLAISIPCSHIRNLEHRKPVSWLKWPSRSLVKSTVGFRPHLCLHWLIHWSNICPRL